MTRAEMTEWLHAQRSDNKEVLISAKMCVSSTGKKLSKGAAQQLYWRTNKENCIIQLLSEMVPFMPAEFALSKKAKQGFDLLCEKHYRTPAP
jgi:hypothetical protein